MTSSNIATTSASKNGATFFPSASRALQRMPSSIFFTSTNEPFKGLYLPNLSSPPPPFLLDLVRQMAFLEPKFVLVAVGIGHGALAVFVALLPWTMVFGAAGPSEGALAVHLVVLPLTLVLFAVGPNLGALAVSLAVLPFTSVLGAVGPGHGALAVSAISFDARSFHYLLFHQLFVPAVLQCRARSAPHCDWALRPALQLILHH